MKRRRDDDDLVGGDDPPTVLGGNASAMLRGYIERIENLEDEKREVAEQIKEVYSEAKANGFDPKTMRTVVSLRKKRPEERQEAEAMLDLYMNALGMLPG